MPLQPLHKVLGIVIQAWFLEYAMALEPDLQFL
jgi:hypothetical protein